LKCPCPREEELRTVHSYSAGKDSATSEMTCPCGKKFVYVKLLFCEVDAHGTGAYAVAQQLKRGEVTLVPQSKQTT
jgi:hypothetical protein